MDSRGGGATSAGRGDGLEAAGSADPSGAAEGGLDSAIERPHDGEARETGGDMSGRRTASACLRRARTRSATGADGVSDFAFAPSWPRASGILDEDRNDGGPADAGTEKRPVSDGNDSRVVARAVWRKDLVVRISWRRSGTDGARRRRHRRRHRRYWRMGSAERAQPEIGFDNLRRHHRWRRGLRPASRWDEQRDGRGPKVPPWVCSVGVEGRELGLEGALLEAALRFVVSLVGDPVVAGDLLEGLDRAVGGGEEGEGLHRHIGGEFRDAEGSRLEADGGVGLFAAVGGPGCCGAGF